MIEKALDFTYKNSGQLALLVLMTLTLGLLVFEVDSNIGSGITPKYFVIALSFAFIALLILPSLKKELIKIYDPKRLSLLILSGFFLLFAMDVYLYDAYTISDYGYSYPLYSQMQEFTLIAFVAFLIGVLGGLIGKRAMTINEAIATNLVVYAKIVFIYFLVAIVASVWLGASAMLYSYLNTANLILNPFYHMTMFVLGSTLGILFVQRFKK